MPPKVMKPVCTNGIGQNASSERGNASKTVSTLFLEAVKLHGRKVTEKNIYDYFETKNIHLKDHLLNLPVMTRSGAVYEVGQSQRNKLSREASDRKAKPKKVAKKSKEENKNYGDESSVRSIQDDKGPRELNEKSERTSARQKDVAQLNSSENFVESCNIIQTVISDAQVKLRKAFKRKLEGENYCEESASQSVSDEKGSPRLKGKVKRSRTKQKDIVQLNSPMGVDERCSSPQIISSDPQVKLEKELKKRKIDADNCDERFATQSFTDKKSFPKSKGKTKGSTAKLTDVAPSSGNGEKRSDKPQIIIFDPQVKPKKAAARKATDTNEDNIEAAGLSPSHEKSLSQLKKKAKRSPVEQKDVAERYSPHNAYEDIDSSQGITYDPVEKIKKAAKRKATDSENDNDAIQIRSSNQKSSTKPSKKRIKEK